MDVATKPRATDHVLNELTYQGSCFCGAVQLTVTGEPAAMGYCHCESCRSWSAAPVNAFTLWKPEAVRITRGADNIGTFNKTPRSQRKWCKTCGGHLFTGHPHWGLIDVYAAVIPDFPYRAGVHVNYQETTLRIRDGLPKMKDVPAEMGGSGVSVAE
ncbi:MAG TPA: GFA family protein [Burkholderiales bacterium]|nr:GFA family protein [Burkholderiales bacterium]